MNPPLVKHTDGGSVRGWDVPSGLPDQGRAEYTGGKNPRRECASYPPRLE